MCHVSSHVSCFAFMAAGFASTCAFALPSLTPHRNDALAITWSGAGMHQHRDTDNIDLAAGKYDGYSCWDNDQYRNGGAWGHGFQELPTRYKFAANFPNNGLLDFNTAVTTWENLINGNGINTNGLPYVTKIDFDQVNVNQAHQIDIFWQDVAGPTAFWSPGATDFTFDSNPSYTLAGDPGELIRVAGSMDPGANVVTLPREWYFGGTGTPTNQSLNLESSTNGGMTWTPFTDTRPRYDFFTIALHELGHAWGLDHIGTAAGGSLMAENISSTFIRTPDAGAIDGLKDIYSIVLPEPTLASGLLLMSIALRRQRSRPRITCESAELSMDRRTLASA